MKELESGKDKIRKICDLLKKETLDPAKTEAEKIITQAEAEARAILKKAEEEAKRMREKAQAQFAQEKELFQKQIAQALQQAKEILRQQIETRLFNVGISDLLAKEGNDPALVGKMITALVEAIEKEGTSVDFSAYIGKSLSKEKVNASIAQHVLQKLREKSVVIGDFGSGAELRLHDRNITLDMTDKALTDLLRTLVRKEFRDLLFQGTISE